jgi:hypothetical protein
MLKARRSAARRSQRDVPACYGLALLLCHSLADDINLFR